MCAFAKPKGSGTILQNTVAELREKLARVTLQLFEVQKYVVPLAGQPGLRSPWTSTSWLEDNEHLLELPRMKSFLLQWETCNCGTEIVFSLCKQQSMTASRVLKHCEWVICNLFKQTPAVYKIGITENPIDRWMGKSYSYKWDPTDDWEQMVILFVGADSMHCALVLKLTWYKDSVGEVAVEMSDQGGNLLSQVLVRFIPMWFGEIWRIQKKMTLSIRCFSCSLDATKPCSAELSSCEKKNI